MCPAFGLGQQCLGRILVVFTFDDDHFSWGDANLLKPGKRFAVILEFRRVGAVGMLLLIGDEVDIICMEREICGVTLARFDILLSKATCSQISRVWGDVCVLLTEHGQIHDDLAADMTIPIPRQSVRNVLDSKRVSCDVFSSLATTSGGCPHQSSTSVL